MESKTYQKQSKIVNSTTQMHDTTQNSKNKDDIL